MRSPRHRGNTYELSQPDASVAPKATEVVLHREFALSSLIPEPGTYLDPNSGTVVNALAFNPSVGWDQTCMPYSLKPTATVSW